MAGITPYTHESWRKTNADLIRSMTDEELAKYLAWLVDKQTCSPEWLIWLKEEVKHEESNSIDRR